MQVFVLVMTSGIPSEVSQQLTFTKYAHVLSIITEVSHNGAVCLQQVPAHKKLLFDYDILFSNNSLLFYPLFYMKTEICFLYKVVSCSPEPVVFRCSSAI